MKFIHSLTALFLSGASTSAFVAAPGRGVVARGAAVAFVPARSYHATTTSLASSAADFAKEEIAKSNVVVFSKSFCPFCSKTKNLFAELEVDATIFELDKMDDGADIQAALQEISGQRTVPNVFINGEHLGGNDDVQSANSSGKLKELLKL